MSNGVLGVSKVRKEVDFFHGTLYRYIITLFAIVFNQWTKLFEHPIYHEHWDPVPLIWRVFN